MTNQPILLHFHNAEGTPPKVSPRALADLTEKLEASALTVGRHLGADGKVQLLICSRPRTGSLVVPLASEILQNIVQFDLSDIWVILFGGRSLFDLWQRNASPDLDNSPQSLTVVVTQQVLGDPKVAKSFRDIVLACSRTGASRVEITVADEPTIEIFPAGRVSLFAVGRGASAPALAEGPIQSVRRAKGPVIEGKYDGRPARYFLGYADNAKLMTIVVIWLSSSPIPPVDGRAHVQGVARPDVSKAELTDVPPEFGTAAGIVRVDYVLL